jgi:hypothetical protein
VAGRVVFYNRSAFDGNDAAADARDDAAVATDKAALLEGQSATFANYTSYSRGVNGIMVDLANLPPDALPQAGDFTFQVGGGESSAWADAPDPQTVSVRRGAGVNGSTRVTITWPDGAIQNAWLRVTVNANVNTRLANADVFQFGNLVGDTGGAFPGGRPVVDAIDVLRTRRAMFSEASVTTPYDFNRDGRVSPMDLAIVRGAQWRSFAMAAPLSWSEPIPNVALTDGRLTARRPADDLTAADPSQLLL